MEYEVGEIFEIDGKKYQVIENDKLDCKECDFKDEKCWLFNTGICFDRFRKDKKNIYFKLIEE